MFNVKLPSYLIYKTIKITSLEGKVPKEVLQFMAEDVVGCVNSVCKEDSEYKDLRPHLKFKAIDNSKKYFMFVPPLQSNASGLKFEHFSDWGLEVVEKPDINLISCSEEGHGNHTFLLPFFLIIRKC